VSEPTARRHRKSLVNTGFAETDQDGQTTLYRRDSDRILMSRIRELREEVTRPELLDSIRDMKAGSGATKTATTWCHRKNSPSNSTATRRRAGTTSPRGITTRQNLAVAQAALAYDEASHQLAV